MRNLVRSFSGLHSERRRGRACSPGIIALFLLTSLLHAGDAKLFHEAQQALAEGIPQVAIEKLRLHLLSDLSEWERQHAHLQLARGYLTSKNTVAAREILSQLPENDETQFLLAQSFLADRNWSEAVKKLSQPPPATSPFSAPILFARAEAHRGLGENSLADADYQSVENDPWLGEAAKLRRADLSLQTSKKTSLSTDLAKMIEQPMTGLLSAQSLLLAGEYSKAESQFRSMLETPGQFSASAFSAIRIGLARAEAAQNDLDEAEDVLEKFIEDQPTHENLEEVFQELGLLYQRDQNPSQTQLRRWSRNPAHPQRQALAIFHQAQLDLRSKGREVALETLSDWLEKFPVHPQRATVLLHYGQELALEKKWPSAIQSFEEGLALNPPPETLARLEASLAAALFSTGQYERAAGKFERVASAPTLASEHLLYNATLAWLRASQFDRFLAGYQTFSALFPESLLRGELLIESGLFQARAQKIAAAIEVLQLFIRSFPRHPRVADAWLALAEMALTIEPADPNRAEIQLAEAAQSTPSLETAERIAYLQIFQKPTAPDPQKQLAQCEAFLQQHPQSKLEAEVRFKMGEAWFAQKNYAAAGTQFEIISSQFPDSPLIEQARFLAGQSAVRTMNPEAVDRAISLFQQVVDLKGPLQAYARFEQASVKKNSGALDEALVLFNDLLDQKPAEDLLTATLAAKGETLYLQGSENPAKLTEAIATFTTLAKLPQITRHWRNLALYKTGKAWGLLKNKGAMLTAFYDVLAAPASAEETPETYWFYRAGFAAAETLESDLEWKAAIAIYKKLALVPGPRAQEAAERIERLRLEHFIWEK